MWRSSGSREMASSTIDRICAVKSNPACIEGGPESAVPREGVGGRCGFDSSTFEPLLAAASYGVVRTEQSCVVRGAPWCQHLIMKRLPVGFQVFPEREPTHRRPEVDLNQYETEVRSEAVRARAVNPATVMGRVLRRIDGCSR